MFPLCSPNASKKREQSKNIASVRRLLQSDEGTDKLVYNEMLIFAGCMNLDHRLVEQCVENLCHKGCRAVWGDIAALDAGQLLPEAEGLSADEIRAVVRELKAIMAVYEGTCAAG